jgi:acyl-CoA synthetase (AMP-forming)/AMP-acid ligase II
VIEARSFWDLVCQRAKLTPDALFAVDEGDRKLSFREYLEAAENCAAGLAALGVKTETPVSWTLPTWLESMILVAALARLGAVQNPILPIYRRREVGFITHQFDARVLVVPGRWRNFDYEQMAREIAQDQPGLEVVVVDRALPHAAASNLAAPPAVTSADDAAIRWLFYTSGTTADPKGALHTDHTLMAFSSGMCDVLALEPDDRIAMVFPFTHVGGIGWLCAGLQIGCALISVEQFDPATSVEVLAKNGVTLATAGTAFHQVYLAAQRDSKEPVFPRVRAFPGGGAPKPPQLHHDIKAAFGGAGIVSGYGLTECPVIAMNSVGDPDDKLANTEGRASPSDMKIRVVTLGTDELAKPGEPGEIRALGPQLCRGYLDASLNGDAFDDDGFFRTGDLGYLDAEGFIVITGRLKDVIIRKGENISAKEVEDALYEHPKVAEVAVIGLPDPNTGERCCAVVACRDGSDPLTFDEMTLFLKERKLMIQKIPEQLETLAEIPRNPTGKPMKHELRARFSDQ